MFNSWLRLTHQATTLGFESLEVISLRLMRIAKGGAPALAETQQMFIEKASAFGEAQIAATHAMFTTGDNVQIGQEVLAIYGKRVRANTKRLSGV